MNNTFKNTFNKKIKEIQEEIDIIIRIDEVNIKLREFNWVFIHPYNQGFEIGYFENLLNASDDRDIEELIFERFAKKFLDLGTTITFLEGYYKKRPFIKDFSIQIEESIILCLQKDFSGAISLLIPVIEGTLRNYLISKKGESAKNLIKMAELMKAFNYMTDDYVNLQKSYLQKEYLNKYFDKNQEKQILNKHREYYSLWIKQLKDYLQHNLYFNTQNQSVLKDDFNRHHIFHGFNKIEFTFKNFLRLINCLNFLTWAIGMIDKNSKILADVDDEVVNKKWVEYFKILTISESMNEIKGRIFGYEIESFKKYIDKPWLKPISMSEIIIVNLLKVNEVFMK